MLRHGRKLLIAVSVLIMTFIIGGQAFAGTNITKSVTVDGNNNFKCTVIGDKYGSKDTTILNGIIDNTNKTITLNNIEIGSKISDLNIPGEFEGYEGYTVCLDIDTDVAGIDEDMDKDSGIDFYELIDTVGYDYLSVTIGTPENPVYVGTSTRGMFANTIEGNSGIDIEQLYLDTKDVTDMSYMFHKSLRYNSSLDLSCMDTSKVTNMSHMFSECQAEKITIESFDTSEVTDMSGMFSDCVGLETLDVSGFDTSKVMDMSGMFSGCWKLVSVDVSGFDTSKVTDMSEMFSSCDSLQSLDVGGFDTSEVTNMSEMFSCCWEIKSLDVVEFDTSKVTDMSGMFQGCGVISLDLSKFNTSKVTNMRAMFAFSSWLESLDLSNFDTSQVTDMGMMFYNDLFMGESSNLKSIDLSSFDTAKVTDMSKMFEERDNLEIIKLGDKFNTTNVMYMRDMFKDCYKLKDIELNKFSTPKVEDIGGIFWGCDSLTVMDLTNFDLSSIKYNYGNKWETSKMFGSDNGSSRLLIVTSDETIISQYDCKDGGTIKNREHITFTFDANGGAFSDGTDKRDITLSHYVFVPNDSDCIDEILGDIPTVDNKKFSCAQGEDGKKYSTLSTFLNPAVAGLHFTALYQDVFSNFESDKEKNGDAHQGMKEEDTKDDNKDAQIEAGGASGGASGGAPLSEDTATGEVSKTVPKVLNGEDKIGYIHGYDDGLVRPQACVTRAEIAQILYNLLKPEYREEIFTEESGFADVKESSWYNKAVSTIKNGGYITGYKDGKFHPNESITRAELTTLIARFIESPGDSNCNYCDVSENYWAYEYIAAASEVGWLTGYSDGSFKPKEAITRAEAVTAINRVLLRSADKTKRDYITFIDNKKGAWYYYDIVEATDYTTFQK